MGSDAIAGLGTTSNTNGDLNFPDNITGTNIKRTGQVISLNYDEVEWVNQPFATRVENVTPYLVKNYEGSIALEPTADVWIDVTKMQPNDVMMEGSFEGVAEALNAEITTAADGSRMGVSPVQWNSWETVGVSMDLGLSNNQQTFQNASGNGNNAAVQGLLSGINVGNQQILDPSDSVVNNITASGGVSLSQQRTGTQRTVTEKIDTASLGSRIVSRDIIHFMRAREIKFTAQGMKPYDRVYAFFDGVDVTRFCVPKLIEIEMISGTFRVSETVVGKMPSALQGQIRGREATPSIKFRAAQINHRTGPHNNEDGVFPVSPYDQSNIPNNYSGSSTILNVDSSSLASDDTPQYEGYIAQGMILRGNSSGARARVTNVRLIPDQGGTLIGTFHVPNSSSSANPIFETGSSTFRLTGLSLIHI